MYMLIALGAGERFLSIPSPSLKWVCLCFSVILFLTSCKNRIQPTIPWKVYNHLFSFLAFLFHSIQRKIHKGFSFRFILHGDFSHRIVKFLVKKNPHFSREFQEFFDSSVCFQILYTTLELVMRWLSVLDF